MIRLLIKMEPVAKARPRIVVGNGGVHSYTPEKTQKAQEYLQAVLDEYKGSKFGAYVPVKLTAVFYRTKSHWASRRDIMPVRKPDIDNFLKLLMDGIKGLLVEDDAQITTINVKKRWTTRAYGCIILKLEEDKL